VLFRRLLFLKPSIYASAAWDIHYHNLDLHLLEAVLPDNDVRGDTVIAVVEQSDPNFNY
jgi:hypothetical protein